MQINCRVFKLHEACYALWCVFFWSIVGYPTLFFQKKKKKKFLLLTQSVILRHISIFLEVIVQNWFSPWFTQTHAELFPFRIPFPPMSKQIWLQGVLEMSFVSKTQLLVEDPWYASCIFQAPSELQPKLLCGAVTLPVFIHMTRTLHVWMPTRGRGNLRWWIWWCCVVTTRLATLRGTCRIEKLYRTTIWVSNALTTMTERARGRLPATAKWYCCAPFIAFITVCSFLCEAFDRLLVIITTLDVLKAASFAPSTSS